MSLHIYDSFMLQYNTCTIKNKDIPETTKSSTVFVLREEPVPRWFNMQHVGVPY